MLDKAMARLIVYFILLIIIVALGKTLIWVWNETNPLVLMGVSTTLLFIIIIYLIRKL